MLMAEGDATQESTKKQQQQQQQQTFPATSTLGSIFHLVVGCDVFSEISEGFCGTRTAVALGDHCS
jgi:hypothetical protein